ncbi:MAG: DUF1538 domain-containing protein [Methylococcales bacterium]|jgi:hypothetical protein|nr:DUF1538 domain-containing protein [Methylococcales bacterium]MBT7443545.1 DUF1538 domain-containing protein [Methylococcales bacterium]
MSILGELFDTLITSIFDIIPIACILFGFQFFVLRKHIPNTLNVLIGFAYVIIGLALFQLGLQMALFPFGEVMAKQLADPSFIQASSGNLTLEFTWDNYFWVYIFAAAIGFSTTVAEPSLLAVALKANQVSSGAISVWGLRIAVALGVAFGIALGTFRIVTGTPLEYYIMAGYVIVIAQTYYAPKFIVALAYDSGGVTTSTVTVPIVTALGLELANTVPGRSALLDGFGLIAFASLFPIISVMAYAQASAWVNRRNRQTAIENKD